MIYISLIPDESFLSLQGKFRLQNNLIAASEVVIQKLFFKTKRIHLSLEFLDVLKKALSKLLYPVYI